MEIGAALDSSYIGASSAGIIHRKWDQFSQHHAPYEGLPATLALGSHRTYDKKNQEADVVAMQTANCFELLKYHSNKLDLRGLQCWQRSPS